MSAANTRASRIDAPEVPPHPIPVADVVIEIRADPARPGGRLVLQDGVESSYVDVSDPTHLEFEYLRHLARVIDTLHPKRRALRAAQIGGGPCALPRYLDATRRDLRCVVMEIDGGVLEVAKRYLGLRATPRLDLRVGDGRHELGRLADGDLDLLVVDAFQGLVVPHSLVTIEFAAEARRVLCQGGVHAVNLIDIPPFDFAGAVAATLRDRYDSVVLMADPASIARRASGNVVIVATDAAVPEALLARLAGLDPAPWRVLWGRSLQRWIAGAAPLCDGVAPAHELALLGPLFGRARGRGSRP